VVKQKYVIIYSHIIWREVVNLKKYLVFIISFVLLYLVFQIFSGVIITALYTPDLSTKEGTFSQEVSFGKTHSMLLLITLVIATFSYIFSQRLFKTNKNSN